MAIICKMCGSEIEVASNERTCECPFCGSKQTIPCSIRVDLIEKYNKANLLRQKNLFDEACEIYKEIISENKEECEAYWCALLCEFGIEYTDDPVTSKKIPTCHRTLRESIFDNKYYKLAIKYAEENERKLYETEAKEIDRLQKEIFKISSKEKPFDIFICYKESDDEGNRTIDSVIAQDIYDQLIKNKYKVFFARITLESKLGSEYEPYIFAALNSAKIMLVIGSDTKYFNAAWVRNEWTRFIDLMKGNKDKYIIPCYKNINPYDMPKPLPSFQSQDLNKLGFMQDLIRGINKIMGKEEHEDINSSEDLSNATTADVLAKYFMKEKNFEKALPILNNLITLNPKNGEAYLERFLARNNVNDYQNLKIEVEFESNPDLINAKKYGNNDIKKVVEEINKRISEEKYNQFVSPLIIKLNKSIEEKDYLQSISFCKDLYDITKDEQYAAGILTYKKLLANEYAQNSEFEKSLEVFKDIDLKEDEKSLRDTKNLCVLKLVEQMQKTKKYDEALRFLSDYIDDYNKDSFESKIKEIELLKINQLIQLNEYVEAYDYATKLSTKTGDKDFLEPIEKLKENALHSLKIAGSFDGELHKIKEIQSTMPFFNVDKEEEEVYEKYYQIAINCLDEGEIKKSKQIFADLQDYKDSKDKLEKVNEKLYEEALSLYENKEYQKSKDNFDLLEDYKDSKQMSKKIDEKIKQEQAEKIYQSAINIDKNVPNYLLELRKAINRLEKISYYKDSSKLVEKYNKILDEENAKAHKKEKRKRTKIVTFVLLGLVSVTGAIAGLSYYRNTVLPKQRVNNFLDKLSNGDIDGARDIFPSELNLSEYVMYNNLFVSMVNLYENKLYAGLDFVTDKGTYGYHLDLSITDGDITENYYFDSSDTFKDMNYIFNDFKASEVRLDLDTLTIICKGSANFIPNTFKITYKAPNGVDLSKNNKDNPVSYKYGNGFTITSIDIPGYDFIGWKNTNTNVIYDDNFTVEAGLSGDITFELLCEPKTYNIAFDLGECDGNIPVKEVIFNSNYDFSNYLTKPGYVLVGFEFEDKEIPVKGKWTYLPSNPDNIILKCHWLRGEANISYKPAYDSNSNIVGYLVNEVNPTTENLVIPELYEGLPVVGFDKLFNARNLHVKSLELPSSFKYYDNTIVSALNDYFNDVETLIIPSYNSDVRNFLDVIGCSYRAIHLDVIVTDPSIEDNYIESYWNESNIYVHSKATNEWGYTESGDKWLKMQDGSAKLLNLTYSENNVEIPTTIAGLEVKYLGNKILNLNDGEYTINIPETIENIDAGFIYVGSAQVSINLNIPGTVKNIFGILISGLTPKKYVIETDLAYKLETWDRGFSTYADYVYYNNPVNFMTTEDGLKYYIDKSHDPEGKEVYIIGYEGTGAHLQIPSKIGDKKVTLIKSGAFDNIDSIQMVSLDLYYDTYYEPKAFNNCNNIKYVYIRYTFSNDLNKIPEGTFVFDNTTNRDLFLFYNKNNINSNIFQGVNTIQEYANEIGLTDDGLFWVRPNSYVKILGFDTINHSQFTISDKINYYYVNGFYSTFNISPTDGITDVFLSLRDLEIENQDHFIYKYVSGENNRINFVFDVQDSDCTLVKILKESGHMVKFDHIDFNVYTFGDCDWTYRKDGTIRLEKYHGTEENYVTPETLDGHPLTAIGQEAFIGNEIIKSVKVTPNINKIESSAFKNCTNLLELFIPESISTVCEHIVYNANKDINIYLGDKLYRSTKLLKDWNLLGDGQYATYHVDDLNLNGVYNGLEWKLTENYRVAIVGYTGLDNVVEFPSTIENYPVYRIDKIYSDKITNVIICSGIEILEDEAFKNCKKLRTIYIPQTVSDIGNDSCDTFTIFFEGTRDDVGSLGDRVIQNATTTTGKTIDGLYWYKSSDNKIGIYDCDELNSDLIIPSEINGLPVFKLAGYIIRTDYDVTIPSSITEVGRDAISYKSMDYGSHTLHSNIFVEAEKPGEKWHPEWNDHSYSTVVWNYGGQTGKEGYFDWALLKDGTICLTNSDKNQQNLVIPEQINGKNVSAIGDRLLEYSSTLRVTIPNTVKVIGKYAFSDTKIIYIEIPESVEIIESAAIKGIDKIFVDSADAKPGFAEGWYSGASNIVYDAKNKLKTSADGFVYYEYIDNNIEIINYIGESKNVVIPKTINGIPVTKLYRRMFYFKEIDTLDIYDNITHINGNLFGEISRNITVNLHFNIIPISWNSSWNGSAKVVVVI